MPDWQPSTESATSPKRDDVICGAHFITGKPSEDSAHPDYVTQVFNRSPTPTKKLEEGIVRYERERRRTRDRKEAADRDASANGLLFLASTDDQNDVDQAPEETPLSEIEAENQKLIEDVKAREEERMNLKSKLRSTALNVKSIENNDSKTNFYTGLWTYAMFVLLFNFTSDHVFTGTLLPLQDEVFITLLKLCLNLAFEDLTHRSGVSYTTAMRIVYKWLDILHIRLGFLIKWSGREAWRGGLPNMYKKHFPHACCIIDCTKVFIDRPSQLKTTGQSWSNYKKHNTLKILVAVTPTGSISFFITIMGRENFGQRHCTKEWYFGQPNSW